MGARKTTRAIVTLSLVIPLFLFQLRLLFDLETTSRPLEEGAVLPPSEASINVSSVSSGLNSSGTKLKEGALFLPFKASMNVSSVSSGLDSTGTKLKEGSIVPPSEGSMNVSSVSSGLNSSGTNATPPFPPPPEPLDTIAFCAEKCRYVPQMCLGLHRDRLSLPAPTCLSYSTTVAGDTYWRSMKTPGKKLVEDRNRASAGLVAWAASRARERRGGGDANRRCEDEPTEHRGPAMWPEEFEFAAKLLANARPRTYLEWGCGASTSFYPLLASGDAYAIDGYPPWCRAVEEDPRVRCMVGEGRLRFVCPALPGADGGPLALEEWGRIPGRTPRADVEAAMAAYVDAIDGLGVSSLDAALVDGRFRLQCALKLLPYLGPHSVVLIHDFWFRENYHAVLGYYYVIGYARSIVALRKREEGRSQEEERAIYKKFMVMGHVFVGRDGYYC